jgi:uracil-DNA glycosylase
MLIEAKADLFAENVMGERALIIAEKNNHPETAKIIKEAEFRWWLKKIILIVFISIVILIAVIVLRYVLNRRKLRERGKRKQTL